MTKNQTLRNLIELSHCKTQKEFATKHGISNDMISQWKSGHRNISNYKLEEIAKKEGYSLNINYQLKKI